MARSHRSWLLATSGLIALAALPRVSYAASPIVLTLGGFYGTAAGFTTTVEPISPYWWADAVLVSGTIA